MFYPDAGATYYVLVFDVDGVGNGGLLHIAFDGPPPAPTLAITVDRAGQVDTQSGIAIVSGSYTCTGGGFVGLSGTVSQTVGRFFTIQGSFAYGSESTCDGTSHAWSAAVPPSSGKFGGGTAPVSVEAFTCNQTACDHKWVTQTVRRRGGAKAASAGPNSLYLPAIPHRP